MDQESHKLEAHWYGESPQNNRSFILEIESEKLRFLKNILDRYTESWTDK